MKMSPRLWLTVKPKIPLVGFDDGRFTPRQPASKVPIIGAVMKGASHLEGVLYDTMDVDSQGTEGITGIISRMLKNSPHIGQLRAILTSGLTFGGFSVLDIHEIFNQLGLPIIVIIRRYPDFKKIKQALIEHFPDGAKRWDLIQQAGDPKKINSSNIYIQHVGCTFTTCKQIIKKSTIQGNLPEPIRVAHLIASSLKP